MFTNFIVQYTAFGIFFYVILFSCVLINNINLTLLFLFAVDCKCIAIRITSTYTIIIGTGNGNDLVSCNCRFSQKLQNHIEAFNYLKHTCRQLHNSFMLVIYKAISPKQISPPCIYSGHLKRYNRNPYDDTTNKNAKLFFFKKSIRSAHAKYNPK